VAVEGWVIHQLTASVKPDAVATARRPGHAIRRSASTRSTWRTAHLRRPPRLDEPEIPSNLRRVPRCGSSDFSDFTASGARYRPLQRRSQPKPPWIPSDLRCEALQGSTDFKGFRPVVPRCPQPVCMTYTQGMGNLWIKKPFYCVVKTIHRFPPSPKALYTGGFSCINPF
jgi:hypothetical protein